MHKWLQYLSLYFFLMVIWPLAFLPEGLQKTIGVGLGKLLMLLFPSRKKIAIQNIGYAYPEYTVQQKAELAKQSFISLGFSLIEMSMVWFLPRKKLESKVELVGREEIEKANQQGHGTIILIPHYINIDTIAALLATQTPIQASYHIPKNPAYADFLNKKRLRFMEGTIPSKELRAMIKALKQGVSLCYLPDQSKYEKNAPYVEFFSVKVKTTTGTSKLAKMGNAKVLPLSAHYDQTQKKYVIKLGKALPFSGNIESDTLAVNRVLEEIILKTPEKYLWLHRRFKDIQKK